MKTHMLCLIIDFRKFKVGLKSPGGLVLVRSGLQGLHASTRVGRGVER